MACLPTPPAGPRVCRWRREEGERFNVWVAYLNTENLYGSEEGTLQLLSRALAHTDARKMYLAAVDIFDRTDRAGLAEQCFKAMCRKFGENAEVRGGVGPRAHVAVGGDARCVCARARMCAGAGRGAQSAHRRGAGVCVCARVRGAARSRAGGCVQGDGVAGKRTPGWAGAGLACLPPRA